MTTLATTSRPNRASAARRLAPLVAALGLALASGAEALPIVQWDLANATGQTASAVALVANVSATDITPSSGVTAWSSTAQDGFVAASGWGVSAPDPNAYYEWTVSAAAGFAIEYDTISLALFRGISGGNHGAESWDLRASTDGFGASDLYLQTFDIASSGVDEQIQFNDVDISALNTVAGTVTFRLYGYDYTQPTDFSGLGNDSGWLIIGTGRDPVIAGNVVSIVPEPGTALLVGLGLVGLARHAGRPRPGA